MAILVGKFTNLRSPKLNSISRISRQKCLTFRGVEGVVFEPGISNIGRGETIFCGGAKLGYVEAGIRFLIR